MGFSDHMTWFFHVQLRSRWSSVGASTCASVQARRCSNVPRGSSHESPVMRTKTTTSVDIFYVDNIGVLATSPLKASELIGKLTTTFEDAGLLTYEVSIGESQVVSLGTVLDCERRRSSLAPRRFRRLRRGIDAILTAKTVTGSTLEVIR